MKTMNFTNEVNSRLLNAVHSIFDHAANRANNRIGDTPEEKRDRCVRKDGGYKCIHLPADHFCSMIGQTLEHREIAEHDVHKLKFIDIGCGVGEKLYLASLFGMQSFGLELRKELIDEGEQLLKSMGHRCTHWSQTPNVAECFIHADGLTYDYKDFDILYFYCPLVDSNLQIKLEDQIAKTAKIGAIVIPASASGCFGYGKLPEGWKAVQGQNTRYFIRES